MRHLLLGLGLLMAVVAKLTAEPLAFTLEFADGKTVASADLKKISGESLRERFVSPDGTFAATRRWIMAPGSTYARTIVTVSNTGDTELLLRRIVLFDEDAATLHGGTAQVVGEFSGSPVVTDRAFFGVEHPLAENSVAGGRVRCALPVMQPLRPGETTGASFVTGVYRAGQLRRQFQSYLERERARPYGPFLHHNTWYSLGYFTRFSEKDELALIKKIDRELVTKRGVHVDGFVLDDGWDDPASLWRFNAGWPNGLKGMGLAVLKINAVPGLWLSPWGGYGAPKQARLAAAATEGYEVRDGSFSLAGTHYYERFSQLCMDAVRDDGVAFFKFDGIGSAEATGKIDPAAGRDFNAMLRLIRDLRAVRPELYVSQTTGTWASPWWLFHVDNIWRDGEDHDFAGKGTPRQQWITYRDRETYRNVVQRGPLFPLNSVMLHGIIYAKKAKQLDRDPGKDFTSEVRSFFGTGTQLQELYLSPELLSKKNWDDLAVAAKWARDNAATLRDVHWIGGDPGKLEVYGWAAWSREKGIVTLRNPSDQPAEYAFEAGAVFELPPEAATAFRVSSPYPDSPAPFKRIEAGHTIKIPLKPFEVRVFECVP
ncbi:MAG: enterotoxin [Verrucomicrobia bacterium]|nr:enterotoxin [Verrucomicrobiota bacterium]